MDLSCPMPGPEGTRCIKPIVKECLPDRIHAGGHMWMTPQMEETFERGHFDARKALGMEPFEAHLPEHCTPACAEWSSNE